MNITWFTEILIILHAHSRFFFSTVYLILVFIFHNYLFYSRYFMLILIFDLSIFIIFSGIFKDVTLMKI